MDKANLQNLCQRNQWKLPEYIVSKSGPDHNPIFMATVKVNGVNYNSDALFRKAKEAQQSAAKVAFHQLKGASATACAPSQAPSSDAQHLYKTRLQNYALKKSLKLPEYSCEWGGFPHAPRFKCKVTFQGKTIESSEFHSSSKEAEQAVAKRAWESLSLDETQQDDYALYKNLLHEYLQKKGFVVPRYEITSYGSDHMPVYVAKVNIQGKKYEGEAASVKKQAESNAAKVAYLGLQELSDEAPPSSPEAAKSAKRLCLPSSDSVRHVAISPSDRNNAYLQVGSSDPRRTTDETIADRPREPETTIPPGSMVFPLSDDQWVAVKTIPNE